MPPSRSKKPSAKPPKPPSTVEEGENPDFDQEKFEVELCWCIQQLQKALKSGKLNEKQVHDHRKAMNVLMSHSTPLVRKRQVMRMSFGDYRAKMAEEDKKLSKVNMKIKLQEAKPSSKSIFFKKHIFSNDSKEVFKFDFKEPDKLDNISEDMSNVNIEQKVTDFKFKPSDNSFRFNFTVT